MTSPDIPPQAITDAIDVTVAKIRARVDQEIAEAVAAERERCAQLADQVGAAYLARDGEQPDIQPSGVMSFAVLLRAQP